MGEQMANGYDDHSLKATGMTEASSSDTAAMVAVRDKRFTKSGIGYRSQAQEATTLDPGQPGQTPPPIMFGEDYAGGTAARRRGMVDEAKLPWQTAEEATSKPSRPRDTLPPGMSEALPPWLKDKEQDEEKEALPPWLAKKKDGEEGADDEEEESAPPDMEEAPLNAKKRNGLDNSDFALPGRKYPIDTPERARSALARVKQFGAPGEEKKVKAAVMKKFPDMKVD